MEPVRNRLARTRVGKLWVVSAALILVAGLVMPAQAQKINEAYELHITRASSPIEIDGVMD